jgi:hypothetical protein
MKFKKETMKANEIGRLFGESSHTINKWLVMADLLDTKTKLPTWQAKREGYSKEIWGGGFVHQEWVPEKVVPRLIGQGLCLANDLPNELVGDVFLTGPFTAKDKSIVNNEGVPILLVSCPENVGFVTALLNTAYRTGTIDRFFRREKGPVDSKM